MLIFFCQCDQYLKVNEGHTFILQCGSSVFTSLNKHFFFVFCVHVVYIVSCVTLMLNSTPITHLPQCTYVCVITQVLVGSGSYLIDTAA